MLIRSLLSLVVIPTPTTEPPPSTTDTPPSTTVPVPVCNLILFLPLSTSFVAQIIINSLSSLLLFSSSTFATTHRNLV